MAKEVVLGKGGKRRYIRAELNIACINRVAKLMLCSGGSVGCNRGIKAFRDLLVTTVRMRRRKLKEWRAAVRP